MKTGETRGVTDFTRRYAAHLMSSPAPVPAPSPAPPRGLDTLQLRWERSVAAILLISGYVWKRDLVIPAVAVAVTVSLVTAWDLRPFGAPYESFIRRRLRRPAAQMSMTAVRTDDLMVSSSLLLTSLVLAMGFEGVAQVLSLLISGGLIIEAAGGVWLSAPLWQRLRSRR